MKNGPPDGGPETLKTNPRALENSTTAPPPQDDQSTLAPVGFEAARYPILAQHFFGVLPPEVEPTNIVADLRFQRPVRYLHHLGPRATGELLAELAADLSCRTVVDRKLARYGRLQLEHVQITGGSDFWPMPIHLVGDHQ